MCSLRLLPFPPFSDYFSLMSYYKSKCYKGHIKRSVIVIYTFKCTGQSFLTPETLETEVILYNNDRIQLKAAEVLVKC